MSEEITEADGWEPSLSVGDDGVATFEVVQGESRNMPVKDLASLINKGSGYDQHTQKSAASQKELQDKYDKANTDLAGYTGTFGKFVEKIKGQNLDEAGQDAVLARMLAVVDAKPASGSTASDDWFGDTDDAPPAGLTKEEATAMFTEMIGKREAQNKDTANLNASLKKALTDLNVPASLHKMVENAALNEATASGDYDIDKAVKKVFTTLQEGQDAYKAAEAAKVEAEKHASGKNISKIGQRATAGADARANAPLKSPERAAYLAEQLEARLK